VQRNSKLKRFHLEASRESGAGSVSPDADFWKTI